jgi:hypothetical protein
MPRILGDQKRALLTPLFMGYSSSSGCSRHTNIDRFARVAAHSSQPCAGPDIDITPQNKALLEHEIS